MTWHHVCVIIVAFTAVIICAHSSVCSQSLPSMITLATTIISGALGHAGANSFKGRISLEKQQANVSVATGGSPNSGEHPSVKG